MSPYKNFLKKLALFQVRHPYVTILILVGITLILYSAKSDVRTVASLEQMMPKSIEEIKVFNDLRDKGLGKDMVGIVISIDPEITNDKSIIDIRDKEVLEYVEDVRNILREESDILEVYSLDSVIIQASNQYGYNKYNIKELTNEEFYFLIKSPLVQNYISKFIDQEYTTTVIIATTDVGANDPRMKSLAENIRSNVDSLGNPPGTEISFTGTPMIQQRLGILISQDRENTQMISTFFVFIITMLIFGTFSSALVPIIVVTLSVSWLYGMMGYVDLPISTLAGGVAAMVIGIGIDYSVHLMNKFKNERIKGKNIEISIVNAISETGVALTGAAVATILAFLAFLVGAMPEMNRFGLLMAMGVGSAFVISIFGLPALLIIEEKIIHLISRKVKFGVEGEYVLYEKDKVHPEDHIVTKPSKKDLESLSKKYKICKPRRKR